MRPSADSTAGDGHPPAGGRAAEELEDQQRLSSLGPRTRQLRQKLAAMASTVAVTEDAVANTLDRVAQNRPRDAEQLRAQAQGARTYAGRMRRLAKRYGQPG